VIVWQRLWFLVTALLIGAAGYWLRFLAPISPSWRDHGGGVAYVIFWIFVLASLAPRMRPWRISLVIFLITCGLEFAQLWHPASLEAIRRTFLGRCILGTTFGWDDFPPYVEGALLGWILLSGLCLALSPKKRTSTH
jgi:hypothetical protein